MRKVVLFAGVVLTLSLIGSRPQETSDFSSFEDLHRLIKPQSGEAAWEQIPFMRPTLALAHPRRTVKATPRASSACFPSAV